MLELAGEGWGWLHSSSCLLLSCLNLIKAVKVYRQSCIGAGASMHPNLLFGWGKRLGSSLTCSRLQHGHIWNVCYR